MNRKNLLESKWSLKSQRHWVDMVHTNAQLLHIACTNQCFLHINNCSLSISLIKSWYPLHHPPPQKKIQFPSCIFPGLNWTINQTCSLTCLRTNQTNSTLLFLYWIWTTTVVPWTTTVVPSTCSGYLNLPCTKMLTETHTHSLEYWSVQSSILHYTCIIWLKSIQSF